MGRVRRGLTACVVPAGIDCSSRWTTPKAQVEKCKKGRER